MRVASLLPFTFLLVIGVTNAADKLPVWIEPMRRVHAEFDGARNYVAQFEDSITTSLAF
jgi:hypothetical protein